MSDDLAGRASRGTVWSALTSWSTRATFVLVFLVLAAELGPRELGLVSVGSLTSYLLLVLTEVGFNQALIYHRGEIKPAAEVTHLVSIATSACVGLVLLVTAPFVADFFDVPNAVGILRAYGLVVAITGWTHAPEALLQRDLLFARRFVTNGLPAVVGGVITVILVLRDHGVWSLVIGDLVRESLRAVLDQLVLPHRIVPRWDTKAARELWRYARSLLPAAWLDAALQNVDYLLVGRLLGPAALGVYTLAFRLAILPFISVTQVLLGVAMPALVRVRDDDVRLQRVFLSTFGLTMMLTLLLACGIAALSSWIDLLGEEWEQAADALQLLAVYCGFRAAAFALAPLMVVLERPAVVAILRGAWLLGLAGALVLFAPLGVEAAAASQVAVAALAFLASAVALGRIGGPPVHRVLWVLGPAALAGASGWGAILFLEQAFEISTVVSRQVGFLLAGTVYVLTFSAVVVLTAPKLVRDVRHAVGSLRTGG